MVDPDARDLATSSLTAAIVLTTIMSVAVFGIRILARSHFVPESANRILHDGRQVRVFLEEPGSKTLVQPQQIGQHEHLSVTMWSGANSNRWNRQRFSYLLREL